VKKILKNKWLWVSLLVIVLITSIAVPTGAVTKYYDLITNSVTISSLTSGRDVVVSTSGLLIDKVLSGTTFPTTPKAGDQFLHTPTGRKILYQWDGSDWRSIRSVGTMTIYVDSTDGTNDLLHGTAADASAFKTLAYVSYTVIPTILGGDVTVYVNGETYTETIGIQDKQGASIIIIGTPSATPLTATGGTQGAAPATCANVTGTFGAPAQAAYPGLLLRFKSDTTTAALRGEVRVIGLCTATTIYLVGNALGAQPANGDTYEVLDWSTVITGGFQVIRAYVELQYVKVNSSTNIAGLYCFGGAARIKPYYCSLVNTGAGSGAVMAENAGIIAAWYCNISNSLTGYYIGVDVEWGGHAELESCRLVGYHHDQGVGIRIGQSGSINMWSCEVSSFAIGIIMEERLLTTTTSLMA
jgi:hypothetical protein